MTTDKYNKSGFWTTLDLLVGHEWRKQGRDTVDEVDDWLEAVIKMRQEKLKQQSKPMKGHLKNFNPKGATSASSPAVSMDMPTPTSIHGSNHIGHTTSNHPLPNTLHCLHDSKNAIHFEESSGYGSFVEIQSTPTDETASTFSSASSLHAPKVIDCGLRHPHVRARLERLMGSNLVRLTDRKYMVHLQERIREDYLEGLEKRMKERSETEMARQKHLVLTGMIPFDQAPKEMYDHPVLVIERYCNKVIAERRAKIKVPKVVIPKLMFLDDSPDAPTALTIGSGHWYNPENKTLLTPQHYLESHEHDIDRGYMFTDEEYDKLHYETPLVHDMRQIETIDELYYIAEQILGSVSNMPPPRG